MEKVSGKSDIHMFKMVEMGSKKCLGPQKILGGAKNKFKGCKKKKF